MQKSSSLYHDRIHTGLRATIVAGLLTLITFAHGYAANEILNPGFESGKVDWYLFVPSESQDKACQYNLSSRESHSGKTCAEISSDDFARFGLSYKRRLFVNSGERYRVIAWVKADSSASVKNSTQGFLIRFVLTQGKADAPKSPAIFIGLNGNITIESLIEGTKLRGLAAPLPTEWTKVEAVVEIPVVKEGIDGMQMSLCGQNTRGTIWIDDVSIEKVSENTPLSPVGENFLRP